MRSDPGFTAARRLTAGDVTVLALSDGTFRVPSFFFKEPEALASLTTSPVTDASLPELPIGAFLIPGDEPMLIDAGIGPMDFRGLGNLIGGDLLAEIRRAGYHPHDIKTVALTHLHPDHVGWLADANGEPQFRQARIVVGRRDWELFVDQEFEMEIHIRAALRTMFEAGQVELIDAETQLTNSVTAVPAHGHTPGHQVFAVQDGAEKLLLLGDAVYCAAQLSHVEWDVISVFDPQMARATRSRLQETLHESGCAAVGCHFTHFEPARAVSL